MNFPLPAIYPITDTRLSGRTHADQVEQLAAGGATVVQLREKHATPREFFDAAAAAVRVGRERNVRILINDRVDIALCTGADGVHIGQDDMPPEAARRLLGPTAVIGYSTHSVEQAIAALKLPIDYVAIGPIFETSTKADPDPVLGLTGLRDVRAVVGDIPLVAIGGINETDLKAVLASGATSAALISGIYSQPDRIAEKYKELSRLV